ncbi:hypothetical protein EB06_00221 [Enterococcus cecorum]|uniref:restriction endonuclease subunit S n=1 Tax=Enterococcus cecorum TaxID=44008 RepID=UPI000DEAB117|nr:restriction endonuclease subunit S [Enterococcus cecorum]RBR35343.1 hypothetical protein EB06_00221 [Enterococcus cecorum]
MNEKKKLQPKVRFREFTGENASDWEQRKLGDIYQNIGNAFVGTATPYYVDTGHFYLESNNIKDGKINRNNEIFINDEFYEKQKDKWLHTGDIVMVQSGHVGHSAVIPRELDNTAAHALIMFRNPKEKIDPYFLNFEYQTSKSKFKINNITTGNTIKHILASDMQKFIVDIPKYEEQKVIANIFRNLDILITLHQRKLEQLEQLKNTLLSKMFPKSGTNIPEIRFSGFTDAWKQRKLEEIIVKEIKGKAKSENISTNFANKGSLYLDTEYLNGGKPKYVSLPSDTDENDIIILWDGSQAGKLYKGVVGALGSTLKAYKIPEHTLFYYYQMLGSQEKIYNQYRTPNIPHVVKSFTSEFMIWDTSNDEKTLIIDIYSNLFNYIAIHQRKLDQLKNLKQTLLNKMFI